MFIFYRPSTVLRRKNNLSDKCLCLYLHQVFRTNDIGTDQRVGRPDASKALAVDPRNRFPIIHVLEVDACTHDILEARPEALQRTLDMQ